MYDKIPKEGRYLFRKSFMIGGLATEAGVITSVSKSRVYYSNNSEAARDSYMDIGSIALVCDTRVEADRVEKMERKFREQRYDLAKAQKAEYEATFNVKV